MGAEGLTWSLMFILLPLTCVYYPVTTLPVWLQAIAWSLPPTAVFEGMRALVINHVFRADLMLWALGLTVYRLTCCKGCTQARPAISCYNDRVPPGGAPDGARPRSPDGDGGGGLSLF